jgi:hypothetical protein
MLQIWSYESEMIRIRNSDTIHCRVAAMSIFLNWFKWGGFAKKVGTGTVPVWRCPEQEEDRYRTYFQSNKDSIHYLAGKEIPTIMDCEVQIGWESFLVSQNK